MEEGGFKRRGSAPERDGGFRGEKAVSAPKRGWIFQELQDMKVLEIHQDQEDPNIFVNFLINL